MNKDKNWRNERDDEGFPLCNEDRDGDLFTDDNDVTYVCRLIPGLGWSWTNIKSGEA